MNNIVGSIFNESLCEKKGLWVLGTMHGIHWQTHFSAKFTGQRGNGSRAQCMGPTDRQHPTWKHRSQLKKEKTKRKRKHKCRNAVQKRKPNASLTNKQSEFWYRKLCVPNITQTLINFGPRPNWHHFLLLSIIKHS